MTKKSRKNRGIVLKIISTLSLIGIGMSFTINLNVPTWLWIIVAIGFIAVIVDLIDGGLND